MVCERDSEPVSGEWQIAVQNEMVPVVIGTATICEINMAKDYGNCAEHTGMNFFFFCCCWYALQESFFFVGKI